MTPTPKKLAVTSGKDKYGQPIWVAYEIRNGRAHIVGEWGDLARMHRFAIRIGYDGISTGPYNGGWA